MKKLFTSLALVGALACGANAQTTINDDCTTAMPLNYININDFYTASTYMDAATVAAATPSSVDFSMSGGDAEDDLWFSFVATQPTATIIVSSDANYDAVVEVYKGSCNSLTFINGEDSFVEEEEEFVDLGGLTVGETYYIRVYDYYSETALYGGEFVIGLIAGDLCNSNTPLNLSLTPDANAGTFTLDITGGTAPYSIYWQDASGQEFFDTLVIGGYTSNDFVYVAVMDADSCAKYVFGGILPTFDATQPISTNPEDGEVAVSEVAAQYNMSVYPNPAHNTATLSLNTAALTDLQIELVNIAGQVVYTESVAQEGAKQYNLPVADLVSGVYFVKVSSKEGIATQKLIIAK